MHLRGKSYHTYADLPDGSRVELLNVPTYSFNWQQMYVLKDPIKLPAGAKVHYVATYDNSPNNPLVLQFDTPGREVLWGERTVDEMMGGYVMYTADRENL